MRKLVVTLAFLPLCLLSKAQFSAALVGGPQVNSVTSPFTLLPDSSSKTAGSHTGISFGFIGNVSLNKKQSLFFRTGALYSARGAQAIQKFDTTKVDLVDEKQYFEATSNLKINYIDVPANLLFKLPLKGKTKFLLGGGIQASLFYNGSTKLNTIKAYKVQADSAVHYEFKETINNDLPVGTAANKYSVVHFSANALTGFEFGRAFITLDYSNGLTDFFRSEDQSFRHRTIGLHLGVFLGNPKAKIEVADRDKDGVPDDVDECPTIPGTALTKGCPDKDGDGIADKDDKCPDQPGTLAKNGCPVTDKDNDGIIDEEDACPDQAGPATNKGCPLFDKDGDGVLDIEDKCPDVPGVKKYNGCPIPDTDGDGVNDEEDQCPAVAGTKENHGCPEVKEEPKQTEVTEEQKQKIAYAAKRIEFEIGKTRLSSSSHEVLDEVAEILKNNPTLNMRIEGHTSGPDSKLNQVLSQKRAESVKEYFISKGIEASRLIAQGFGSSRHISKDGDKKENPEDRRVELIIF